MAWELFTVGWRKRFRGRGKQALKAKARTKRSGKSWPIWVRLGMVAEFRTAEVDLLALLSGSKA